MQLKYCAMTFMGDRLAVCSAIQLRKEHPIATEKDFIINLAIKYTQEWE